MIGKRVIDIALYHLVDGMLRSIQDQTEVRAPIYIPSRHRAGKARVARLLDDAGLDYRLVVEPHDLKEYARHHPEERVLVLPSDDFGISNVRNWILDHAKSDGWLYAWQVDDDIASFVHRIEGRRLPSSPRHLMSIVEQIVFSHDNVAGSCIPNEAYIFGYDDKPPLVYNGMIYQVQLLRTDTGVPWRDGMPNDPDRTLQLLAAGWATIVPRRFGQSSPSPSTHPGGLTDTEYANGGRLARFQRLVDAWPGAYRIGYMNDGTPKLVSRNPYGRFKTEPRRIRTPRWRI